MNDKHDVHHSSKSQTWNTPLDLFRDLDSVWNFTTDVACLESSALCTKFYTPEDDGLIQDWGNEICWCNPPYDDIKTWSMKVVREFKKEATIVLLIPSRTDTIAFQEYLAPHMTAVCFIKGSLRFQDPTKNTSVTTNTAPFPSALFVFDNNMNDDKYSVLNKLGTILLK